MTDNIPEPAYGELSEAMFEPTPRPWNDVSPKVTAGALGAAIATIAVWGVETGIGIDVPVTVETAGALIVAFLLGYLVPDTR